MVIRTAEIKRLETIYNTEGNQLVFLFGRDGCGMDGIISQFLQGKKSFYYKARNVSIKEQFAQFEREIIETYHITAVKHTYDECFNRVKSGDSSKLVIVIDNIEFMIKKDQGFIESILKLKAKKLYPGPVMILMVSSALSWCQNTLPELIEGFKKQVNAIIKLDDATFLDVVRGFPEYSVAESTEAYGILGGVPGYLNRWNGKDTIKNNICQHILSPNGFLFREAERYLSNELRELAVYETILGSIAAGNEKLNDLFLDTGYSRPKISVYMKNLAAFDVVEKVVSFDTSGWDNAKKGVYRISNSFINFWFTFIYPHLSALYTLEPEEFYDRYIADDLDDYLRRYFVKVCGEYLQLMNIAGQLSLRINKMGTWVGKQGTIDIIGEDEVREHLVGICNWSKPQMTYSDYEKLLANMKRAKIKAKVVYLFSATSFDEDLESLATSDSSIVLVDMKEL